MSCSKSYKKKRSSMKRTSGGGGTADWGNKIYGTSNNQARGPDGSLKMDTSYAVQIKGGSPLMPMNMKGGRRHKKGGKGVLTDIAVPAVLLYANTMTKSMGKSSKKRHYNNKSRKSRK